MVNILVLCTGNSARSILLECLLRDLGNGRIQAFSAGSKPSGAVHPGALALLRQKGYEVDGLRSKSWDDYAKPGSALMNIVLTVCNNAANEVCPIWPGAPISANWAVADPAHISDKAESDAAFQAAYQVLRTRAQALLDQPFEAYTQEKLVRLLNVAGKAN
jgi:arsenate reductase (thioredoxin)